MMKPIKEYVIDKKNGKKVRILLPPSRNSAVLASFATYCKDHPKERFWQALRNWSGYGWIMADNVDTFYWEGRDNDNHNTKQN